MYITISNVKATLATENLDVNDTNAVTQQVANTFPNNEGWSYDFSSDTMYIQCPNPIITAPNLGEVQSVDYTVE